MVVGGGWPRILLHSWEKAIISNKTKGSLPTDLDHSYHVNKVNYGWLVFMVTFNSSDPINFGLSTHIRSCQTDFQT